MHAFCRVALLSWNNESGNSFMREAETFFETGKKGEIWDDTQTARLARLEQK